MTDIVERLRESADEVEEFPHPTYCDHLHVAFKVSREAADEIESLRTQLAAAQKDAARYRWLREADPDEGPAVMEHHCNDWGKWYYIALHQVELDTAIDAAMQPLDAAMEGK